MISALADGRKIDKLSEQELRTELRKALHENAELVDHARFSADWVAAIQGHRRHEKMILDAQQNLVDCVRRATECRHENLDERHFEDVICYYCPDCKYGWSD